jgi:cell division protein FtsL
VVSIIQTLNEIGLRLQNDSEMRRFPMQLGRLVKAFILVLAVALLSIAAGSLSAQQVTYNFMPGTDFTKYHTYKWVQIPANIHPNQIVDQEIKEAINNALAAKGYTQATGDKADLYVGYQCSVDQERQWNAWGTGRGFGGGMGSATSSTISNGTLAVDFYDPGSQDLVWRGQATKTLNPSGNQEKDMERLNKAMQKLLKNFPPKQK